MVLGPKRPLVFSLHRHWASSWAWIITCVLVHLFIWYGLLLYHFILKFVVHNHKTWSNGKISVEENLMPEDRTQCDSLEGYKEHIVTLRRPCPVVWSCIKTKTHPTLAHFPFLSVVWEKNIHPLFLLSLRPVAPTTLVLVCAFFMFFIQRLCIRLVLEMLVFPPYLATDMWLARPVGGGG